MSDQNKSLRYTPGCSCCLPQLKLGGKAETEDHVNGYPEYCCIKNMQKRQTRCIHEH